MNLKKMKNSIQLTFYELHNSFKTHFVERNWTFSPLTPKVHVFLATKSFSLKQSSTENVRANLPDSTT